jgi:hypothetical protein
VIGSSASFNATTSGAEPIYFLWYHTNLSTNTTAFPAQTTGLLAVTNIQTTDFGSYVVVVSNSLGAASSRTAALTVAKSPLITQPRQSGSTLIFHFQSEIGPTYVVQYKDDLNQPLWETLTSYHGDGSQLPVTDNVSATNQSRFYRIHLQ